MKKFIGALLFVVILTLALSGCVETVPDPEIKYGEFNFSVTYEYLGEVKTISGIYVCEYSGVYFALDGGFNRGWKGYVKDGTTEEMVRLGIAEDGGIVDLMLDFNPGRFMGDDPCGDEPFVPCIAVTLSSEEGIGFESDAKIVEETYGAKIINYEHDAPIENSFGSSK